MMLFLSILNCNYLSRENGTCLSQTNTQQGIVLIVVLWITTLGTGIMIYLLSSSVLHTKLIANMLKSTQRFEAAESGLLHGETELAQLALKEYPVINRSIFAFSPIVYQNYTVTLHIVRLPYPFCIKPMCSKGYYYQLTATAHSPKTHDEGHTRLQSIVALPGPQPCHAALTKRQIGRSAWCQLS